MAGSGTVVTDTLPAGLAFVSATGTGLVCTPSASTSPAPGPRLCPGRPRRSPSSPTSSSVTGTIVNTAEVTGPTPDPDTGNNTDTDSTTVTPSADLSIQKAHTVTSSLGPAAPTGSS